MHISQSQDIFQKNRDMIKRKRKRNPLKDDKKLMRKVAEFLAKAIEKEPDGIKSYLLAADLVRRDSLYCEECHSFDIKEGCDWDICYPEIYDQAEDSTLESAKEAAEDLADDLGIVDYVKVFRYEIEPSIKLNDADLSGVNLSGVNLSGANLSGANLAFTFLIEANLNNASLIKTNMNNTSLSRSNLSKANLSGATLFKTDLSKTDLSKANLSGANLSQAILLDANLSDANLSGTHFTRTNLFNTNFTNSLINNYTIFDNVINEDKAIRIPPEAWQLFRIRIVNPKKLKKSKSRYNLKLCTKY